MRVKALPTECGGLPDRVLIEDQSRQSVAIKRHFANVSRKCIDAKRQFGVQGVHEDTLAHMNDTIDQLNTSKTGDAKTEERRVCRETGTLIFYVVGRRQKTASGDFCKGKERRRNYAAFDGGRENCVEAPIQAPIDLVTESATPAYGDNGLLRKYGAFLLIWSSKGYSGPLGSSCFDERENGVEWNHQKNLESLSTRLCSAPRLPATIQGV
ncbi:hypothetical protein BC830DRAFT_1083987 [Chytriomyces sp. MP71]|nr:hypothetical protein BC830DRAFT_1083987 [Chytriomyces sp. MP71]